MQKKPGGRGENVQYDSLSVNVDDGKDLSSGIDFDFENQLLQWMLIPWCGMFVRQGIFKCMLRNFAKVPRGPKTPAMEDPGGPRNPQLLIIISVLMMVGSFLLTESIGQQLFTRWARCPPPGARSEQETPNQLPLNL